MDDLKLLENYSFPENPDLSDPHFHICWRRQSCSSCLTGNAGCSWCAISSTCVPNPSRVPILAPIGSSTICPLGSKERWEMRAMPFGCNASTLTVLSVVVAVLGTLALGAAVVGGVWLVRRTRRRWKETEYERIDEERDSFAWSLVLAFIVGLFPFWSQMGRQNEAEGDDAAATRPLLE